MWDAFLTILGLFGGSLAGVFALGIFTRRAHAVGAVVGIATSVLTLFFVQTFTSVHFFCMRPSASSRASLLDT